MLRFFKYLCLIPLTFSQISRAELDIEPGLDINLAYKTRNLRGTAEGFKRDIRHNGTNIESFLFFGVSSGNFNFALGPNIQLDMLNNEHYKESGDERFTDLSIAAKAMLSYQINRFEPFAFLSFDLASSSYARWDEKNILGEDYERSIRGRSLGREWGLGARYFVTNSQSISAFYAVDHGRFKVETRSYDGDFKYDSTRIGLGYTVLF